MTVFLQRRKKLFVVITITALVAVLSLELYVLFGSHASMLQSLVRAIPMLRLQDVAPQIMPSLRDPASGEIAWYFKGYIPQSLREEFDAGVVDKSHFSYYENGEIHPPRKYDVENNYSQQDIEKMKAALKVAYRYADINKALEDGYRIDETQPFSPGMGIHVGNPDYILDDEVSVERPEFLTYIKNRKTGRFQLAQIGFIAQRAIPYTPHRLFDAEDARGHSHFGSFCLFTDGVYMRHRSINPNQGYGLHIFGKTEDLGEGISEEDCKERFGGKVAGPSIWMMHFAVNMYNRFGMFSDYFPYVDYLSAEGITHSFFGKRM